MLLSVIWSDAHSYYLFQSMSLRGGRHFGQRTAGIHFFISIHVPTQGRDDMDICILLMYLSIFQSTSPRGGRPQKQPKYILSTIIYSAIHTTKQNQYHNNHIPKPKHPIKHLKIPVRIPSAFYVRYRFALHNQRPFHIQAVLHPNMIHLIPIIVPQII